VKRDGPQHASRGAKGSRQIVSDLTRDIKALEGIEGAALLAGERQAEVARLQEQIRELQEKARLKDIRVWVDSIVKQARGGKKKYEPMAGGPARRRQAAQGLPGILQEADPKRGPSG